MIEGGEVDPLVGGVHVGSCGPPEDGGDVVVMKDVHVTRGFDALDEGRRTEGLLCAGGEGGDERVVGFDGGAGKPADGCFDGGLFSDVFQPMVLS